MILQTRLFRAAATAATVLFSAGIAWAQVPETVHYQGQVTEAGEPFHGSGAFKFAIVDGGTDNVATATATASVARGVVTSIAVTDPGGGYTGTPDVTISGREGSGATATAVVEDGRVTQIDMVNNGSGYSLGAQVSVDDPPPATIQTLWSNDGSSSGGSVPGNSVSLTVNNGIFSVALGDTALAHMDSLPAETFATSPVFLRVWFEGGGEAGFEQLIPDQPITATPYAMHAATAASVADGAIRIEQIDDSLALWSSADGNFSTSETVGIGLTDPQAPLHVVGSTVTGHHFNEASGHNSFVSGGLDDFPNTAGGTRAFVGGGGGNEASGLNSFVAGGTGNTADGRNSFAAGTQAAAEHEGTFVWSNFTLAPDPFASTGTNQFLIQASGGVGINTNSPAQALDVAGNILVGGWIGTAEERSFELRVGNDRALRIESVPPTLPGAYDGVAPNIVGGWEGNSAGGAVGATISGGGGVRDGEDLPNIVTAPFGTVSGGLDNTASGNRATVGGGSSNSASGSSATVAGGVGNSADWGGAATVGGGSGNVATGSFATVPGGRWNEATGTYGFAAGRGAKSEHQGTFVWADSGMEDFASTGVNQFLIRAGGGVGIGTNNPNAPLQVAGTLVAGDRNNIASGKNSFVSGGSSDPQDFPNSAIGYTSFVAGGMFNLADGGAGFIGGGFANRANGEHSFAAGTMAIAKHHGTFVWADRTFEVFTSTGNDQFLIRAGGGVGINTNNLGNFDLAVDGSAAKPGGGSWSTFSDARLKNSIEPLASGTLDRLLSLKGYTFEYTPEAVESRLGLAGEQIGLIAQEVAGVFPGWVDADEEGYLYVTERGTMAILIESLRELRTERNRAVAQQQGTIDAQAEEINELRAEVSRLSEAAQQNEQLEARLVALENRLRKEPPASR